MVGEYSAYDRDRILVGFDLDTERRRECRRDEFDVGDRGKVDEVRTRIRTAGAWVASSMARRVLPIPPTPVSVISRSDSSNGPSTVSSSWRPTIGLTAAGQVRAT